MFYLTFTAAIVFMTKNQTTLALIIHLSLSVQSIQLSQMKNLVEGLETMYLQ